MLPTLRGDNVAVLRMLLANINQVASVNCAILSGEMHCAMDSACCAIGTSGYCFSEDHAVDRQRIFQPERTRRHHRMPVNITTHRC